MSVKYYSKFTYLHSRKCIWKCRLRNIGNLVSASMSRHKFAMVMIPNKVLKLGIIISLWIVTVFEIPVKIQSDWWTQLPVTIFCISVNLDLLLIWINGWNWLQIYLESRFIVRWSMFLKSAVQVALLLGGLYTAATRVTDNRHHLDDVIAGCALGGVCAVWAVSVVCDWAIRSTVKVRCDYFKRHFSKWQAPWLP